MVLGYTSKVALKSSRASDVSTASLILTGDNEEVTRRLELNTCGNFLIGNLTAPLGLFTYHLEGIDSIGLPFTYTTRQTAMFTKGSYAFSTVGPTNTQIERSETPQLIYRLQNLNIGGGYITVEFTATVEPTGGFDIGVQPRSAKIRAGESIDVTLTPVVNSSLIEGGNPYRFNAFASDGCTTVISEAHTVSIREPVSGYHNLCLQKQNSIYDLAEYTYYLP